MRNLGQGILGAFLLFAGTGHLTFARTEFLAQVPSWVPLDADLVVVLSGVVEVLLGLALLAIWRQPARGFLGLVVAAFFVAIFPGNVAQFVEGRDGFGLDSDLARGVRLLFQPLLVVWALVVTDALKRRRSSTYSDRAPEPGPGSTPPKPRPWRRRSR